MKLAYPCVVSVVCLALWVSGCQTADVERDSRVTTIQDAPPPAVPHAETEGGITELAPGYLNPAVMAEKLAGGPPYPKSLRILVFGAHPADVFDQSGGTMAHHVMRGDWVGCVVLTHGARVHDKVVSDQMRQSKEVPPADEMLKIMAERADVKSKEVVHACSILGVKAQDVYFLGADDAVLLVTDPMVRKVAGLIRKLKPDIIITHYPFEDGGIVGAHATCGQIVLRALEFASGVDPGDKTPPHRTSQVFFFGIGAAATRVHLWSAQGGFYNDVVVDITDVADKKVACLDSMVSQGYGGPYARKRIEASDAAFGNRMRFPYAEGFISLNSTSHYYLPISEIDLERERVVDHDILQRWSYKVKLP